MDSIRDRRVEHELRRYPLMDAPPAPWGEILSLTVPAYHLRFDVDHTYPFRPPILYFKGENAVDRLKKQYAIVVELLRPYRIDFPCICCRILVAPTRWVPCLQIDDAVDNYLRWADTLAELTRFFVFKPRLPFDDLVFRKILHFLIQK